MCILFLFSLNVLFFLFSTALKKLQKIKTYFNCVIFSLKNACSCLLVQIPGEHGRDGSGLQVPVPDAGGQLGLQAGLVVLRTLLHTSGSRCALRPCEERPV